MAYNTAQEPLPAGRLKVSVGSETIFFGRAEGLETGHNNDTKGGFSLPGGPQDITVTLQYGLLKKDSMPAIYDWISSSVTSSPIKHDLTITLLSEEEKPLVSWEAPNAFATNLEAASFMPEANENTIDALEVVADKLDITFH